MPWQMPERKTEQAFKALLASIAEVSLYGVAVVTRFSGAERSLPHIEIACLRARPDTVRGDIMTGNWMVDVRVTIRSRYEKAKDTEEHDRIAGVVSDVLFDSDIVASLNTITAEADFLAFNWTPGERSNDLREKDYETELTGSLHMAPSKCNTEG
jgi:hypothetical protein